MKWQTPSGPIGGSNVNWRKVTDELRTRPGEWALVKTMLTASSAASSVTKLKHRFPGFEFVSRGHDVYARAVQ